MNPKHLTPNVRRHILELDIRFNEMKKEGNPNYDEDGIDLLIEFYEKIKDEVDNELFSFLELCELENRYGFVSGYIGGTTLNTGDTIIRID